MKKDYQRYSSLKKVYERKALETKNWTNKYNKTDAKEALFQWNNLNKNVLKYLKPSYYSFKKQIKTNYNFSAHKVEPSISKVIETLNDTYELEENISSKKQQIEAKYGFNNLEQDYQWVQNTKEKPDPILRNWLSSNKDFFIQSLIQFQAVFDELVLKCESIFGPIDLLNVCSLDFKLQEAQKHVHSISALLPYIEKTKNLSSSFKKLLFSKAWSAQDFEVNLAFKNLEDIYEKDRQFSGTNHKKLNQTTEKINRLLADYYAQNVASIRSRIRDTFLNKIRITESVAAQLTPEEKILKKQYNAGRRILENEFGKSMRFKSIRDLTTGEANEIMTSIKPVWLMSPLSVSDTMPIDSEMFDVVIFDEASQITVEEGIPALFRTKQTIIVGDEMQMPPTNFFSTNNIVDEEDEEIENTIGISLDADSILNQGARKLSAVMLGWHYRSRRESLISFSNAAFYERKLLTIPDNTIYKETQDEDSPIEDIFEVIDIKSILDKSISFQYIKNGLYENRKNKDEANYIANLVNQILKAKTGKSIGIVVFSMQQQGEIEAALERLAYKDADFDTLLEEEYQREDEDSFNGLFVKNLENVQGDERDIIIMSVCYGHNASGRLLMNFGPINRKGGEKRLNVIFSRAKQNMIVVSSILPQEIKNDYNLGANYFKKFLSYAKNISTSKLHEANLILDSMFKYPHDEKIALTLLEKQVGSYFDAKGYQVDYNIGQSHFKCNIAIREKNDTQYKLGIIIDKTAFYENENVIEQYCQKPKILEAFGWNLMTIYAKDWLKDSDNILKQINQKLNFEDQNLLEISEDISEILPNQDKIEMDEKVTDKESQIQFERYEYKLGATHKYWQIAISNTTIHITFGRIGSSQVENQFQFNSLADAQEEMKKLIGKKLDRGYFKVNP